jgi:hypothetical protein
VVINNAALRAANTVNPDNTFEMSDCGFFVVKVWGGKNRHNNNLANYQHRLPQKVVFVKYINAFLLRESSGRATARVMQALSFISINGFCVRRAASACIPLAARRAEEPEREMIYAN